MTSVDDSNGRTTRKPRPTSHRKPELRVEEVWLGDVRGEAELVQTMLDVAERYRALGLLPPLAEEKAES